MANLYSQFRALLPDRSIQVVTVVNVGANGTSTVQTDAGSQFVVIGDSVAAGNKALVQEGQIISEAPTLPSYTVSV